MCGIAGFNWSDAAKIKEMTDAMVNRGPDDEGQYVDEHVSLGHRRLSIIDLSSAGHQPMFDESKELAIIHNGEIYNFLELREELKAKGYTFKSNTDTETILYAYKEWGPGCVLKFNGIFAFVIYDVKNHKLFLARDHVGIKPLYYFHDKKRFIFCSTPPPMLLHNIPKVPNKKMIRDFLLYSITEHTNETFFRDIQKFPKGHYGTYDLKDNTLKLQPWWKNKFTGDYEGSYEDAVKEFKGIIQKAVNDQLISDVPVGVCLSGGMDSSTMATLINVEEKTDMKTFSAIFPGFERDESKYVDTIVKETGMANHKVTPTAESMEKELFNIIQDMGEPIPSPSLHTQYEVFHLCDKNNVTVLLNGEGADELLAGYHYFFGFYLKGLIKQRRLKKVLAEKINLIKGGKFKLGLLSLGFLYLPKSLQHKYFFKRSNISKSLYDNKQTSTSYFDDYYGNTNLHDALKFHLDHKLEHLLKWEDRPSMAYSKEARVPFLDVNVMKFIFKLPEEFIISQGKTKAILRDAMRGQVPDEILDRRDKIGFDTPEDLWLRSKPFKEILNEWFLKKTPQCEEYIDLKKTRNIIRKHIQEKGNYGRAIWRSVFLEAWILRYQHSQP